MLKGKKMQKPAKERLILHRQTKKSKLNLENCPCQANNTKQTQNSLNQKTHQECSPFTITKQLKNHQTHLSGSKKDQIGIKNQTYQAKDSQKNFRIKKQKSKQQKLQLSRSHSVPAKCSNSEFSLNNDTEQFQYLINELFNKLSQEFIIQNNFSSVRMKRDKFKQILASLLQHILSTEVDSKQKNQMVNSLIIVRPLFCKISKILNHKIKQHKIQKFNIHSNIFTYQFHQSDFKKISNIAQLKFNTLVLDKQKLEFDISSKNSQLQIIQKYYCQRKQQLSQLTAKFNLVSNLLESQTCKLKQIQKSISQRQQMLTMVTEKTQKIVNFVEVQEEKKILHWVSEAYKKIQAQIYDYAAYLQCNALYSSLTWEPKPFRAVQKWVYQQMNRINELIMCQKVSIQQKCQKMKEYITDTTRKFRTKDQEMMKITDYKTECIMKYIKMMQKWIQNWELKQQYLVSLRQQFVVDSHNINKTFEKLSVNSQTLTLKQKQQLILELKNIWNKVQLNYKHGNSFY